MISLLNITGAEIVDRVRDFFNFIFVEFASLWYWPIIVIGLMILAIIIMIILIVSSYENRILKSINKINAYFLAKPFITDENLVEFNLKMKKVPKALRNSWQIYMLNREDTPSTYINTQTCIDKPLRTSSIEKNMSNFSIFTICVTLIAFIVGIQYASTKSLTSITEIFFNALLVPLAIVFLYTVFILIMKLLRNDIYSTLYDNFPLFERNLTKAVSTLPSYVDYEVLFTKKEIREGIPILQQYLEKRALIEQQELEKARENSVACEEYNFDELGIDGSLVLERAMKECETFIKTRRRLQEECDEIETEKENYKKNFEITEKDFQRKLQASRENLESLRAQQEASTNRIESNYIKKQQGDEIKKQQQLEKDSEEATAKFKEEQVTLEQEIEKRKQEIEEKRAFVEQAMLLEFKHYANTLYKALSVKAAEIGNQKVMNLAQENADLRGVLNDLQGMQVEAPTLQENLVQPEEVGNGDLYQMTQGDEKSLEEGRIESAENAQVEDEKEQQKKEEKKAEEKALAENGENGVEPNSDVASTEAQNAEGTDATADESSNNTNTTDDGATSGDSTGDVDASVGGDGGQQMAENTEEATDVKNEEQEMAEIQKKIEEENANLQMQKEELAKDLNNTISQMDNNATSQEGASGVVEEPEVNSQTEVEAQPETVEESVEPEVQEVAPEAVKETEPDERSASSRRASSSRPARRSSTRSSRASSPRGRSTRSSGTASKVNSEIDALNAEMEKLLDSTKK